MGATTSRRKRYSKQSNSNIYSTPPKGNHDGSQDRLIQIQCDPRSPTDGICRTPIQIDGHLGAPSVKLRNHILSHIVTSDGKNEDNQENEIRYRPQRLDVNRNEYKRLSDVEPTLDPNVVLNALMANTNGQLPPYQL